VVTPIISLPYDGSYWGPLEQLKSHLNSMATSANGNFYSLEQAVKKLEEAAGITTPAPGTITNEQKIAALEGQVASLTQAVETLQNRLRDLPQTSVAWA
jgi:ubiquinone biosynthesis protein UbiJ